MFNIEEKIKAWYQNNANSKTADDEEKKKNKYSLSDEKLKELGVEVLTDEELKEKAENSVKDKYDVKEIALTNDLKLNKEKANLLSVKDIDKAESKKDDVDKLYDLLNKDAVNNSIKQGISRSSIIDNQIEENNNSKELDYKDIQKEVDNIKKSNEEKINLYNKEYENAKEKLNLEKFIEMNSIYDELKTNQDKEVKKAIEKREAEKAKMSDKEKEEYYQSLLDKYKGVKIKDVDIDYINGLEKEEQTAIRQHLFEEALSYYYSLPKEEALDKYKENTKLQELLGTYSQMLENYLKLYK